MTEHDKAIIEAAEKWFDERGSLIIHPRGAHDPAGTAEAIARAVAAKREAAKPKLAPYHEIIRAARNAPPVQNNDCEIIAQTRLDAIRAIRVARRQQVGGGAGAADLMDRIEALFQGELP